MMWTTLLLALTAVVALPTPDSAPNSVQPVLRVPLQIRQERSLQPRRIPLKDLNYAGNGPDTSYFAELTIGTPPQNFSVLVDTGSGHLVIAGSSCNETTCNTFSNHTFHPDQSSTFTNLEHTVGMTFARGAMGGTWGEDTVVLDNVTSVNQTLVVASQINRLKHDIIGDGILGLSWGSKDNGTAFSSIWETLPTPQFGLWLARRNETSANGGSLTLGGFDTDVIHGEIDWIDTAPGKIGAVSSGWWIPIEGITYSTNSNGTAIGDTITIENTTAMVDSGSTYSYGSHEILDKLYLSIPGVKKYQSHNYYGYSANPEIAQNLSMSLHFNGREYKIDKDDLFRCGQIKGSCISTFLSDGRKEATWIIGANFMKNVYTAFRGSPPAVGFASLKTNAISDSAVNSTTSSRTLQPDETEQSSTPQPDETEQSEEVSTPSASGAALAAKQDNSAARLVASSKSLSQLFASFLVVVTMFDLF